MFPYSHETLKTFTGLFIYHRKWFSNDARVLFIDFIKPSNILRNSSSLSHCHSPRSLLMNAQPQMVFDATDITNPIHTQNIFLFNNAQLVLELWFQFLNRKSVFWQYKKAHDSINFRIRLRVHHIFVRIWILSLSSRRRAEMSHKALEPKHGIKITRIENNSKHTVEYFKILINVFCLKTKN